MQKGQGSVEDGLLRARSRQDLGLGIQRNPVSPRDPAAESLAQIPLSGRARVLAHLRDPGDEGLPALRARRLFRVAGAEVEETDSLFLEFPATLVQPEQRVGACLLQHGVQEQGRGGRARGPVTVVQARVAPGFGTGYIPSTPLTGASNIAFP